MNDRVKLRGKHRRGLSRIVGQTPRLRRMDVECDVRFVTFSSNSATPLKCMFVSKLQVELAFGELAAITCTKRGNTRT